MIYKFRPIDKFSIMSLTQNYVWMSSPNSFNDPYDTMLKYEFVGTSAEWQAYIPRVGFTADVEKRLLAIARVDPGKLNSYFSTDETMIEKSLFKTRQLTLVCSFSKTYQNPLMWSHYAASHSGLCLCYSTFSVEGNQLIEIDDHRVKQYIEFGGARYVPLMDVRYSAKVVGKYNPIISDDSKIADAIRTKHSNWRYERETRLFKPDDGIYDVHLANGVLTEVLLGAKISSSDEEFIIALVDQLNTAWKGSTKVYKIHLDHASYRMRKLRRL